MPGSFEARGFAVVPEVLAESDCQAAVDAVLEQGRVESPSRAWLTHAWCQKLATSLKQHAALAGIVAPAAVAVQCTLFEKSPDNNWLVSLHQDLSIPVRERVVGSELTGWSTKEGALFVQPPVSERGEVTAVVSRGGVLAMRPLLLHASSKAVVPSFRRVLHFVFGPPALPCRLRWAATV